MVAVGDMLRQMNRSGQRQVHMDIKSSTARKSVSRCWPRVEVDLPSQPLQGGIGQGVPLADRALHLARYVHDFLADSGRGQDTYIGNGLVQDDKTVMSPLYQRLQGWLCRFL